MIHDDIKHEESPTFPYRCRDIGYGVEQGEVYAPALSNPDWVGKRAYQTTDLTVVYLFDDELEAS